MVVVLLHDTPGPVATTTSGAPAASAAAPASSAAPSTGFPAPPPGATVFTHQDGGSVLALAVTPQGRRLGLQASVVGQQGGGTSGLGVSFASGGHTAAATACGAGCYRATLATAAPPRAIDVAIRGKGLDTRWHQPMPTTWPPPSGAKLLRSAGHVWRSLRSLAYVEHLASDPQHAVTSSWRVNAPDRAAYQVVGGYGGIIIGGKRLGPAAGRTLDRVCADGADHAAGAVLGRLPRRARGRERHGRRPPGLARLVLRPAARRPGSRWRSTSAPRGR